MYTTDEVVVHIYNGILYSHKKEPIWVLCRDVDGPRIYLTEWNKSERDKKMYINALMWNLEKCYQWTYLQGRNRDADVENRYVDMERGKEGDTKWERRIDVHTRLLCVRALQVLLVVKNLPASAGGGRDAGSIPGSGRFPTPVFLLRESHGWRSLTGYSSWGHKESGTAEVT